MQLFLFENKFDKMDFNTIEPVAPQTQVEQEDPAPASPREEHTFRAKLKNVLPDDFFVDFKLLLYSSVPLVCPENKLIQIDKLTSLFFCCFLTRY